MSRKGNEAFRKHVVQYWKNTAERNKATTIKDFQNKGKSKVVIYRINKRYVKKLNNGIQTA